MIFPFSCQLFACHKTSHTTRFKRGEKCGLMGSETVDAALIGADVKGSVGDGQPKSPSVERGLPYGIAGGDIQGPNFTVAAGEEVTAGFDQGKRTN